MAIFRFSTLIALCLAVACSRDDAGSDGVAGTSTGDTATGGSTQVAGSGSGDADTAGTDTAPDSTAGGSSGGPTGYLDVYDIEGDLVFPEGIAFDPEGEAFFVGSLSDGAIRRIDVEGNQSMFASSPDGLWTSSGLKVDPVAGRVWVCAGNQDDDTSHVWVLDLDSGDTLQIFDLADTDPESGCNDLALDPSGVAYVSDPPLGAVHRIEFGGADEVWATHADWAPLFGLGVNGLAVTPDEAYLIQGMFTPPALFRVALDDGTDIVPIALSGDAFEGGAPIAGVDGIVFSGDAVYVTFADVVKRVDFADEWSTGTVTTLQVPGAGTGLSTAAEAGGAVYVVKSEVTAWVLGSAPELPFQIIKVPE